MKNDLSKKAIWVIGLLLCLGVSYLLCRFVFFDIHGMKDWPNLLAGVSLIVLLVAIVLKLRWMSATTAFGYIVGFVLGVVFNTDGSDPGGGRTNNLWIIWTAGLLFCIIVGLVVDIAVRIKYAKKVRS
jgi:hypothetical protein